MNTETAVLPAATHPGRDPSRPSHKAKPRFIVTFNNVPCALTPVPKMFGTKLVPKRGVLLPNDRIPTLFPGEKSAQKAIGRAMRLRTTLRNAVFELPPSIKPFAADGQFRVTVQS